MTKFFKVFMVSVLATMIFSLTLTANSEAVSRKKAIKIHEKAYKWMVKDGRMASMADKEVMKYYKKIIDAWNGIPYTLIYSNLDEKIGRSLYSNKLTAVLLCTWGIQYFDDLIYGSRVSNELSPEDMATNTSLYNLEIMKLKELSKIASDGNIIDARKLIYNVEKYYNRTKTRGIVFNDKIRKKVCKR